MQKISELDRLKEFDVSAFLVHDFEEDLNKFIFQCFDKQITWLKKT